MSFYCFVMVYSGEISSVVESITPHAYSSTTGISDDSAVIASMSVSFNHMS